MEITFQSQNVGMLGVYQTGVRSGMTVRDIQHHMITSMGVDISHETISAITDAVLDEVMIWQNRQLDESLTGDLPRCTTHQSP